MQKADSSLELHGTLDVQREYTQKTCGIDHIELKYNNGKNYTNEHENGGSRTMELLNKNDKLVQEVPLKSLPGEPHFGQFENSDLLEVKEDQVQKGREALAQQQTNTREFKNVEDIENTERIFKDDGMRSSSKMSHASASKHVVRKRRNEKLKLVQEGCRVPPQESIDAGEFKDLEDWEKNEKPVIQVSNELSLLDESKEEHIFEEKEKPAKKDCMDPLAGICADKSEDRVNLEMKEKSSVQGDRKVISPEDANLEKFRNAEPPVKKKRLAKNLATVQSCGSKSKGVSQEEDQNADVDCGAQKSTDLFAKEDGLQLKDADFTMDLEFASDPNKPISMTQDDLDAVKNGYFTGTPCQTPLDQQTTTKDEGNCVSDLEFDAKVCNSLVHSCDDMVPKTCITECEAQAPPLKQLSHVMQDKNTLRDLQFKLLRAKGSSLTDQSATTAKTPQAPSEIKSIKEKSKTMENPEKALLGSLAEEHNDKSTDQEEMQPSKNCSTPKNDTMFETGMESSKITDCKIRQTKGELEKTYSSPLNPFTGLYTPCKNVVQSYELESEGKVENTRSGIDVLICETINPKSLPSNACSVPAQLCGLPSTLQAAEKVAQAKVLGREAEDRCPTPTIDEEPYVASYNLTSSNNSGSATHFIGEETCKKIFPGCPVKSSTLTGQQKNSGDVKDPDPHHYTNTDIESETQEVIRSTDRNRSVRTDLQSSTGIDNKGIDKGHVILDQICSSLEVCPYSQRPVMAVKPSEGDKTQGSCASEESLPKNSLKSNHFEAKTPIHVFTIPTSIPLNKNMEEDMEESSADSAPCSWLSNAGVSMCTSGNKFQQHLDPLNLHEKDEISRSSKILSSHLEQSSKGDEDTQQKSQTAKENMEPERESCSFESSPSIRDSVDGIMDYGFVLGPQNSLACTIFNTNKNRPESLLEKLSKRCIQDDPTQASLEQECLIFSEKMKQLLKRAKSGPTHELEAHDKINLSCPSPMTVRFSDLEEVETEVGHFDEPSFVLPKIKVDISDRKTLADTTGRETTPCPQEESNGPVAHASVSGVTAECARLYTSMMNDVCGISTVELRPNHLKVDKVLAKTQPSNHFDFCDQMKREVDYNFCSRMNSVVRKFCKTKYKFFILATSDDVFFEKTKVRSFLINLN